MKEYYLIVKTDLLFLDQHNSPVSLHTTYESAKQKIIHMKDYDEKNDISHNEYKIHPMELVEELNQLQTTLNLL
jgi:hypothetical protein